MKKKVDFEVLPSKMNLNLSEKEQEYLDTFIRKGRLSFEINQIIIELEKIDNNTTFKDSATINKIINILFLSKPKEVLPNFISKSTGGVYICRRTIKGKRVVVSQSTDLKKVFEEHKKFCIKHNLKRDE